MFSGGIGGLGKYEQKLKIGKGWGWMGLYIIIMDFLGLSFLIFGLLLK